MAEANASLAFFIYAVFLSFGLFLKSFIMSIGSANIPTPPKRIKNIHPKKDKIATIYTAKDASS